MFRELHSAGLSDYSCHFETKLSTFDIHPKHDAKNGSDAQVDFYLKNLETGHTFYADVTVTHPSFRSTSFENLSEKTLDRAVERKYSRYLDNYDSKDLKKEDLIPLAFDSYGGYADITYKFLQRMSMSIAKEDNILAAKVFRNLRDRIAVALHTGNVEIINWLNSKNQYLTSRSREV